MISRRSCLGLFLFLFVAEPVLPQDTFEGVQRIIAIGDIHGDYGGLVTMLRIAKLIDANLAWQGGAAHLVILGDFLDRGPDSRKVMDLLIELGPQAESTGGRVHVLLGNHEAMNIYGDLRYVSPEDFDSFRTPDSKRLIDEFRRQSAKDRQAYTSPEYASDPGVSLPLGWVEHRLAFLPSGKYGRWLRQQNVVIRINDFLFVHGGISPKYAKTTRKEVNERVRAELTDFSKLRHGLAVDPDGPLWYRDLAQQSDRDKRLAAHVDRLLETQEARHLVIGHTPAPVVLPRFEGKVILADVGLSMYRATPSFLLVEESRPYSVYERGRAAIPLDAGGVLPYLREAQTLDPANSRLRALIRKGGRL